MSDPKRGADICSAAKNLPRGSVVIYRHFGAGDRREIAARTRQIAFERRLQFLIGKDETLAREVEADGLHVPESDILWGAVYRQRYPDWILSCAVHNEDALTLAESQNYDATLLSPVFASDSSDAGAPLGTERLKKIITGTNLPVFALGGVNPQTAPALIGSGIAGIAGISAFMTVSHA